MKCPCCDQELTAEVVDSLRPIVASRSEMLEKFPGVFPALEYIHEQQQKLIADWDREQENAYLRREQERWGLTYVSADRSDYYGECFAAKTLLDGTRREVTLIQWSLGASLCVGPPNTPSPLGYNQQWNYQRKDWAFEAFQKWHGEGEPERWYREVGTGRRRTDGDPEKEYYQP